MSNQVSTSARSLLRLPKFNMAFDVRLNYPLEILGMKDAFIFGKANFLGMTDDQLFISQVKQKSYVDVDEEGTEAAAATVVIHDNDKGNTYERF